jgi:hypothetical protein
MRGEKPFAFMATIKFSSQLACSLKPSKAYRTGSQAARNVSCFPGDVSSTIVRIGRLLYISRENSWDCGLTGEDSHGDNVSESWREIEHASVWCSSSSTCGHILPYCRTS